MADWNASDNNSNLSSSFFTIDKEGEDNKHSWLVGMFRRLSEQDTTMLVLQRKFLRAYIGKSYTLDGFSEAVTLGESVRRSKAIKIPHIHDITEVKVAQMTQLKTDIEVLPRHDEYTDRAAAKVSKFVIRNIFEEQAFDAKMIEVQRYKTIMGESFIYTRWDPDAGDLHPAYKAALEQGMKMAVIDGKEVRVKEMKPIRVGEVKLDVILPSRIKLQAKKRYEDVDYCMIITLQPSDEVVKDYPDKKELIEDAHDDPDDLMIFNPLTAESEYVENHKIVVEFYHKKTKYLPRGKYIKFTEECILEQGHHPYSHGDLPITRLTDIDMPQTLRGVSKYLFAIPVQRRYDHLNNLLAKNIFLTANAKWFVQQGSVNRRDLGNLNTIVEYALGSSPPQMSQAVPNPNEVYNYVGIMRENLDRIMGSHGISRGELPKGVTAASALQYLNELESNRATSDISKHGDFVKKVAKKALSVASDYYSVTDGRLIKVVGEGAQYAIKHFDTADLSKPYDVRFENSSGFPETRAAREQRLLEMYSRNPQQFTPERWEELLMGSSVDKAASLATVAIRSADSENEDLLNGRPVAMPEEYEDHIAHLRSHYKAIQSRSFKEEVNTDAYVALKKHITDTETLAQMQAGKNPLFGAELARLRMYPMFIEAQAPPSAEQATADMQGASNRGEPTNAQIPATPMDEGDTADRMTPRPIK